MMTSSAARLSFSRTLCFPSPCHQGFGFVVKIVLPVGVNVSQNDLVVY